MKCTLGIFLHLLLRLIFCQLHPNFINVRTANASENWAQLTKNHLTKSSTERLREYIQKEGKAEGKGDEIPSAFSFEKRRFEEKEDAKGQITAECTGTFGI